MSVGGWQLSSIFNFKGGIIMEGRAKAHVIVSGKVQGVFFRAETQRAAESYDVSGWVKNRMDGTVEAVFEGDEADVKAMVEWCRDGSPHSKVTDVNTEWEEYSGEFSRFEITY
ncbi:acylphosphatase [Desulfobacterales bacterium HSG2]|nr:acylphosphatase [Desulfobacterales bacterium HSG2]